MKKAIGRSAVLVLADGTFFEGIAFGAMEKEVCGELVFATSMTGYVELLTDPSYHRQILTLTYPEIGNCGVARCDAESDRIFAKALVVRGLSPFAANWRSDISLDAWLKQEGVPGISGIDTRALVRHLRTHGSQMAILSTIKSANVFDLHERARQLPGMAGLELVSEVSTKAPYEFTSGLIEVDGSQTVPVFSSRFHVAVVDFGVKHNMLRLLVHYGCKVTVFPCDATAEELLKVKPDGLLLSNGPGDPEVVKDGINTVKSLLGMLPIFGICMGHQVLSLAVGAKTFKLQFGHRGANQPVMGEDRRVMITSQNHGFAVEETAFNRSFKLEQKNLSDNTVEGISVLDKWAFGVQYHPEAAPGPHDAEVHFRQFLAIMEIWKNSQDQSVLGQEILDQAEVF